MTSSHSTTAAPTDDAVELELLVRDAPSHVKRPDRGAHAAAVLDGCNDDEVMRLLVERQRKGVQSWGVDTVVVGHQHAHGSSSRLRPWNRA
jgi:hypothetical protein